eukprot:6473391-Amphidinium_carterae.1
MDDLILPAHQLGKRKASAAPSAVAEHVSAHPEAKASSSAASSSAAVAVEAPAQTDCDRLKDAKARAQSLRQRCSNTISYAVRLLFDPDLQTNVRIMALATRPLHMEYTSETRRFRNRDEQNRMVLGWCERDYIGHLSGLWSVLDEQAALERLGIAHTELARRKLRATPADSEFHLHRQDEYTQSLATLVTELVSVRACSYVQYSDGLPHCVLRLISLDPRIVQMEIARLRTLAQSVVSASRCAVPALQQLARESEMHSTFMMYVLASLCAEGFKRVSANLVKLLTEFLCGVRQTRIIEEGNQRMRDVEQRKSMNKSMRALSVYDSVACSGLVDEYGYRPITPHATPGPPPSDDGWKRVFDCDEFRTFAESLSSSDAASIRRDGLWRTEVSLQQIQSKAFETVHSTNPAGELERLCGQSLLYHLEITSSWPCSENYWMSGLLPVHELVHQRETPNELYHVLWSGKFGSLLWRVTVDGNTYAFSRQPSALVWAHVLDLESWFVQPSRFVSPLESSQRLGRARISRASTEDCTPLLPFLAKTGFAHLSESVLKALFAWNAWPHPELISDSTLTWQETLRLDLMQRCCPDMSASDAISAMHSAVLSESPSTAFAAVLDTEIMRDVIIPGEHDTLETELATLSERVARNANCARRVRQSIHHWTWGASLPKSAAAVVKSKPPREYSGGADDTDAMRVYLKTHGPPGTQICTDLKNARIQLGYRGKDFQRKSVSWHSRGTKLCMKDCLHWLWTMRERHTGELPAWHSS